MQTFLPYQSYKRSARVLDNKRLFKQCIEAKQIVMILIMSRFGWKPAWENHPAVKMWRGHEQSLCNYGSIMCHEGFIRGMDTGRLHEFFVKTFFNIVVQLKKYRVGSPKWLGNRKFHLSHKSNLKRKKPEHYAKFWPNVPNDLPYIWPTK